MRVHAYLCVRRIEQHISTIGAKSIKEAKEVFNTIQKSQFPSKI